MGFIIYLVDYTWVRLDLWHCIYNICLLCFYEWHIFVSNIYCSYISISNPPCIWLGESCTIQVTSDMDSCTELYGTYSGSKRVLSQGCPYIGYLCLGSFPVNNLYVKYLLVSNVLILKLKFSVDFPEVSGLDFITYSRWVRVVVDLWMRNYDPWL